MQHTPVGGSTPSGPPSVQMRPSLTPTEMSQQTPGSSHMHAEAQQVIFSEVCVFAGDFIFIVRRF